METNNSNQQAPNEYTLTEEDLKQVKDDAEQLLKLIEENIEMNGEDFAQLLWTIGSDDYTSLCSYQIYLRYNFPKNLSEYFYLEQRMWCMNDNATLSIVIDKFPIYLEEIMEVSQFIFSTAKVRGCKYTGVDIDIVFGDDPRIRHDVK